MSAPSVESWTRLKRLARYLVTRDGVVFRYEWQDKNRPMTLFTDSDWAGCRKTRKSTSGGAIMIGTHCVKAWSSTQGPIALSSAEAECYSMVEGTTRAKGMQTLGIEIGLKGLEGPINLFADASAARSFASRRGLGRMRHIDTRELWLQGEVLEGRVVISKVRGEENPADLMTKYLVMDVIQQHLSRMSVEWRGSACVSAVELRLGRGGVSEIAGPP